MNRVVITGAGCVSPYGVGCKALWQGVAERRCAIASLPWLTEADVQCHNGASVPDFAECDHFSADKITLYDRSTQFALLAASEAMAMSSPGLSSREGSRAAVYLGSATAGSETRALAHHELLVGGARTLAPLTVPRAMFNAAASHIGQLHQLHGPSMTISTACASSTQAIGEAFRLLQSGQCELALAGGTDACLNLCNWKAWEAIRAMAPDTCRPFSLGRRGMVLGEGAGILVLESRQRALARNATILGEIVGYSANCHTCDIVKPSSAGAALAMQNALQSASVAPAAVQYVNAHGTGTPLNDASETRAIHSVFGSHAPKLAVSSVKSGLGHLMGAAGAVELIAGLMAFIRDTLPATLNYERPDPQCDLDYVIDGPRTAKVMHFVKNSFAFGGLNVSLVLRHPLHQPS